MAWPKGTTPFPAYARVYHPFRMSDMAGITSRWSDLPELAGLDIHDAFIGGHVAMKGVRLGSAEQCPKT